MAVWDDAVFLWDPNSDGWSWDRVKGFPAYGVVGGVGAAVGASVSDGGINGRIFDGAVAEQFPTPLTSLIPPQEWTLFAVVRLNGATRLAEALAMANTGIANQYGSLRANNAADGEMNLRLNNAALGANYIQVGPPSLFGDTAKKVYVATAAVAADVLTISGFVDSSTAFAADTDTPTLTGVMDILAA